MLAQTEKSCWVSELRLSNFRNYSTLTLEVEKKSVVITGPNGTGKTNLLEALSLLSPNKGLKRAKITQLQNFSCPTLPWTIYSHLMYDDTDQNKIVVAQDRETLSKKLIYINDTASSQSELYNWTTILWLTPFMDQIFLEGASLKRKFLDRLICALYPSHQAQLAKLDYALRERSKLLRDSIKDASWYHILEERIARESVAVIVQRQEYLRQLNHELKNRHTPFPIPDCQLAGPIESWLEQFSALTVEEKVMQGLHQNRSEDLLTKTNSLGGHQSELCVNHLDFNRPAEVCSTGEQKALLLSILLAHARLSQKKKQLMPILLLDEVVAHLDNKRREKLFLELGDLNMQAWLTGTDAHLFEPFAHAAQFFSIKTDT